MGGGAGSMGQGGQAGAQGEPVSTPACTYHCLHAGLLVILLGESARAFEHWKLSTHLYLHCWEATLRLCLHASCGQMWRWRSDHVSVHSPVGGAAAAGAEQSGVQSSVDEATDNAVKVAEQNRQAASETLSDVKRQISQHRAD